MEKYDVIIIGGGTAGCSCAYNCAKLGLKTLLVEKNGCLGGMMTSGLVVPMMETGNSTINTDFHDVLISEMKNFGAQITYQNNSGWLNPEILKAVLDKLLLNAGVDIIFNTSVYDVKITNNKIVSVSLLNELANEILLPYNDSIHADNTNYNVNNKDEILSPYIEATYYVDSTGNLNFSKKINCEFLQNNNDFQPMSLRFLMSGIDLHKFSLWLQDIDTDRGVTTVQYVQGQPHLSTAYTWDSGKHWALSPLFNDAINKNILKPSDCNYFQIFTVAGMQNTVAFNCPRIPKHLNPNLSKDTSYALISGREAVLRLANFCKTYFPGFENAYISNISDNIGIRSSNRIKGKYVYSIDDLRSGRKFENPVLISNYPVDVHSASKDSSILEKNGEYQLPIESLMSADYDNLFIAGRGISADELSQGALRVQSSCFSMGEAVAKYIKNII